MPRFQSVPAVPAAVLAQRVLDVWTTKDDASLATELQDVLHLTRTAAGEIEMTGIEAERQELLRAIARSMDSARKVGAAQEPRLGVYVELLRHLSVGGSASPSSAPN
jgi:hypothetical protein